MIFVLFYKSILHKTLYQQEKPDAVLMDSRGNKLGLEITHLFYSEQEARQLLQREHANDPQIMQLFLKVVLEVEHRNFPVLFDLKDLTCFKKLRHFRTGINKAAC